MSGARHNAICARDSRVMKDRSARTRSAWAGVGEDAEGEEGGAEVEEEGKLDWAGWQLRLAATLEAQPASLTTLLRRPRHGRRQLPTLSSRDVRLRTRSCSHNNFPHDPATLGSSLIHLSPQLDQPRHPPSLSPLLHPSHVVSVQPPTDIILIRRRRLRTSCKSQLQHHRLNPTTLDRP